MGPEAPFGGLVVLPLFLCVRPVLQREMWPVYLLHDAAECCQSARQRASWIWNAWYAPNGGGTVDEAAEASASALQNTAVQVLV